MTGRRDLQVLPGGHGQLLAAAGSTGQGLVCLYFVDPMRCQQEIKGFLAGS